MIEEITETIRDLEKRIQNLRSCLDVDAGEIRIAELQKLSTREDFWNDQETARTILQEKSRLEETAEECKSLESKLNDAAILFDMAREEEDEAVLEEIQGDLKTLEEAVRSSELKTMLGEEEDRLPAIMTIHAGAGGTEAQDWAEMLLRMYLRWAEQRRYKTDIIDYQPGDEAGVKSVTVTIEGDSAYGYAKAEVGIHRLVRISPFDTGKRRHTSFASVFVYPEIDDSIEVDIDETDLRIDTYRSSGAGGQHVNKTDSAVRITHLPTGIVVQCQNERSQHKNRAMAMKILRSRLYEMKLEEQRKKLAEVNKTKKQIAWGSQIRSYVLHPYKMVKDHRTNLEVGNVDRVLDGDIDDFIEAYLIS
ncbi:MAG: peptide chain release factor 2 [Deltaproteobacteria bacterium]|nr:peptide chain release factor 2 [Deltaproteobacteria bacterium]